MHDRYLKGVLTVIAGALVWIAFQLSMGNARAAVTAGMAEVQLVDQHGTAADARIFPRYVPVYCGNCDPRR